MLRLRVNKVCRSDEKRWIWLLPNAPGGRRPRELRTRYGEKWPRQPVRGLESSLLPRGCVGSKV